MKLSDMKSTRVICGNIPDNEKIILFIAVGHYPDTVTFAASRRKFPDDVFIVG